MQIPEFRISDLGFTIQMSAVRGPLSVVCGQLSVVTSFLLRA